MDKLTFMSNIASLVGAGLSLLSLLISVRVYYSVTGLKRIFLFNVRVVEWLKQLERDAGDLKQTLDRTHRSFPSNEARTIMVKMDPTLQNLQDSIPRSSRQRANQIRREIKALSRKGRVPDYDDAKRISDEVSALTRQINDLREAKRLTA